MPQSVPSLWRALGLGVAVGYAGLGFYQVMDPGRAAVEFYDIPHRRAAPAVPVGSDDDSATAAAAAAARHRAEVTTLVRLLGARDLSFAAVILGFAYGEKYKEAGSVILGGMILCAADVVAVWRAKGTASGLVIAVGAGIWGLIGSRLAMT
ncbi:hypothetical protein BX600DRAFT_506291 [Xylariales sp. PMI_506]|nr:hypothetical protein BX600DRAFT_506291 [Xylariales sp. PMI_506]